nr:unnamed protein product [Microcystis aeruginosa PCC 7806]
MYRFQLLLGVGTLIEFYFKLIICITIPEEPQFIILNPLSIGHISGEALMQEAKGRIIALLELSEIPDRIQILKPLLDK